MNFSSKRAYITKILIAINIIFFLYIAYLTNFNINLMTNAEIIYNVGGITKGSILIFHEYYRLITAMFVHIGFMHLLINMLTLYYIGIVCENSLGHLKFIILYMVSGILGNLTSVIFSENGIVSAGASTALFGLLAFFLLVRWYYPNNPEMKNMSKTYAIFIVLNLVLNMWDSSINIAGHIGGLVGGIFVMIVFIIYQKISKNSV